MISHHRIFMGRLFSFWVCVCRTLLPPFLIDLLSWSLSNIWEWLEHASLSPYMFDHQSVFQYLNKFIIDELIFFFLLEYKLGYNYKGIRTKSLSFLRKK